MRLVNDPTKGFTIGIAAHRSKRPTLAKKDFCPFCPNAEHLTPPTTLQVPAKKWLVRCFENAFPIITKKDGGRHEVIVESNKHDEAFEDMMHNEELFSAYQNRFNQMKGKCVFLFKNSGVGSGASIYHEHSQIISLPFEPEIIKKEKSLKKCVFCSLLKQKPLYENDYFKAVLPEYGRFPFETWVIAKSHGAKFGKLSIKEGVDYIRALQESVRLIKKKSPAYNIALHTTTHLHAEIYTRKSTFAAVEYGTGFIVNTHAGEDARRELLL